jgi:hypothetical protein
VSSKGKSIPENQGTKRSANGAPKSQPKKRQKREDTPLTEDEDEVEDSELTPAEDTPLDSDDSDAIVESPPKKAKKNTAAKPAAKRKGKEKIKSDMSEDGMEKSKPKPKSEPTPTKSRSKPVPKSATPGSGSEKNKLDSVVVDDGNESDLSDLSDVFDEAPKSRAPKPAKGTMKAPAKSVKAAKPKVVADLTPEEVELKTLQSQLKKCGVNKIWGFELKQFEDDAKAKIKHLRKMLKDIGMEGRFSEARAKEIKERRELMQDVEAIQEEAGRVGKERSSRAKAKAGKSMKEPEDSGGDEEEEDPHAARIARAQADLAFLGSEESSDDD